MRRKGRERPVAWHRRPRSASSHLSQAGRACAPPAMDRYPALMHELPFRVARLEWNTPGSVSFSSPPPIFFWFLGRCSLPSAY